MVKYANWKCGQIQNLLVVSSTLTLATMKKDIEIKRIYEVIDCGGDESNFTIPFNELSKKYGAEYIVLCKAMWQANDNVMTEEEFMKMNGNMPRGFFEKVIK